MVLFIEVYGGAGGDAAKVPVLLAKLGIGLSPETPPF